MRVSWFYFLGAVWLALVAGCDRDLTKTSEAPKTIEERFAIKVGERTVQMQLAVYPAETQKGLMFRASMPEREGMLFVFERPQQMGFWMKNTSLPLDIGYFDAAGELKEIYPLYPFDERSVRSISSELQLALEMNQGWFARNGVKPGAKLDVKALQDALQARGIEPKRYGFGSEK